MCVCIYVCNRKLQTSKERVSAYCPFAHIIIIIVMSLFLYVNFLLPGTASPNEFLHLSHAICCCLSVHLSVYLPVHRKLQYINVAMTSSVS